MADTLVFRDSETISPATAPVTKTETLAFYEPTLPAITPGTGTLQDNFLLVDQPGKIEQTQILPADIFVLTSPAPPVAVDFRTGGEVFSIVSGGPPGAKGDKGDPGVSPVPYEETYAFPTPATSWTISHNQNTKALGVNTFDLNGDALVGDVEFTDLNTVTVRWYYPTSGSVVIFD